MKILEFREQDRGALRAYFSVKLSSGLCIRGCKYFKKDDGSRWIGYPDKEYTNRDGERKWSPYIYFEKEDRLQADKLKSLMLDAIDQYQPEQPTEEESTDDNSCPF